MSKVKNDINSTITPQEKDKKSITYTVPELRFSEFKREWEAYKLIDVLDVSKLKNEDETYDVNDVLSVSREAGVVNQIEYHGRSYAGKSLKNYKVIKPGDIVYTKSPLKDAPYGVFQISETTGIVSPLYAVYKSTDKVHASYVALSLLNDNIVTRYLAPLVTKGAKNTINVTDEGALEGELYFPSIDEQEKISQLFLKINKLISLQEKQVRNIEKFKQAMLQKMFPNKKKSVPELRFSEFKGEWEAYKLIDVLDVSKLKNEDETYDVNDVLSVSREAGVVNQIEYHGRSYAGKSLKNYKVIKPGDIVYTKSPLKDAPYGVFQISETTGIVSPLYAVYKSTDKVHAPYVALSLLNDNIVTRYLAPLVTKGAKNTINVTDEGALEGELYFPSIDEQKQISKLFKAIDEYILIYRNRANEYKTLKQGLLQKMFI